MLFKMLALSTSREAISSKMVSGSRSSTSSSQLGFLTERSQVASSTSFTSKLQEWSESAKDFWRSMNSDRSASFKGLVLPRRRPSFSSLN